MKSHLPTFSFALAALALGAPLAAAETNALRYKFTEGSTNAYRITVDSPAESMPTRMEGFIVVGVRAVDENIATVFFRGRLQPKPNAAGPRRMAGPGPFANFGPHGPHGPRIEFWRFMNIQPFNEAQVDSSGRLLRVAGLHELPKPLDTYADIFFHQLPVDADRPLQTEQTLTLADDLSGRGHMSGVYYPGGPGGGGPARLTGLLKESIRVTEKSDTALKLQKIAEFQSFLKTDDEPRLSVTRKAELVFDPRNGLLKTAKIEGVAATATLQMSHRQSLNITVEQMDGADLAKAIADTAERPNVLTEADVQKLVRDLQDEDPAKSSEAAQQLLSAEISRETAVTLLPVVRPFLNRNEPMLRSVAARVLARAATAEHLPLLHRLLKVEDSGHHLDVIQALGRLKDKSSIPLLADIVAAGSGSGYAAIEALAEFGAAAEEPALALLKERHQETRRAACQILGKVGTLKSIEALQALIATGDPQLIHEATEALRAIRQRGDETSKLVF